MAQYDTQKGVDLLIAMRFIYIFPMRTVNLEVGSAQDEVPLISLSDLKMRMLMI